MAAGRGRGTDGTDLADVKNSRSATLARTFPQAPGFALQGGRGSSCRTCLGSAGRNFRARSLSQQPRGERPSSWRGLPVVPAGWASQLVPSPFMWPLMQAWRGGLFHLTLATLCAQINQQIASQPHALSNRKPHALCKHSAPGLYWKNNLFRRMHNHCHPRPALPAGPPARSPYRGADE